MEKRDRDRDRDRGIHAKIRQSSAIHQNLWHRPVAMRMKRNGISIQTDYYVTAFPYASNLTSA